MFHSLDCINWHEQNNEMLGVTLLFNNKHLIQRQGVGRGGGGLGETGQIDLAAGVCFRVVGLELE